MITAAGVGSGIDIEGLLSQLGEIERQPINTLNQRRAELDVELSAYGTVKGALSSFQSAADTLGSNDDFGEFVATSSDEEVFTAVANGGDVAEQHEIEVLALATNHRLSSDAYASADSAVPQGTFQLSTNDNTFDIEITSDNDTVEGLRNAINDSLENTSVSASIVNVDGGHRLILTAKESGTDGAITFSNTSTNILSPTPNFSEVNPATDASLIVHGFTVTRSSNSISDVIDGVTLNLTGTGKSVVKTERDTESLRTSLDEFVSKYNAMSDTLKNLSQSSLQGDQLPRGVDSRMRALFFDSIELANGDTASPLELGFTFNEFGVLSIKESRYQDALDTGVNRFVEAFSQKDTGIADRFSTLVDEYVKSGGIIDTREDGVDSRRNDIDDQIERLEYRLEKTNARLRRQFTSMDLTVTNLQSTSQFLTSRLGNNF